MWSVTRTFDVSDDCGNDAIQKSVKVTYKVDNELPVITTLKSDATLGCNPSDAEIETALGGATASDNCDGDISGDIIPSTGDPVSEGGCMWSVTRTFDVSDDCGNDAIQKSVKVTYKVDNELPVISTKAVSGDIGCNPTVVPPVFTGLDNCDGVFDPVVTTTGKINTGDCNFSQTWYANYTDNCLNDAVQASITYTWTEVTAPVFAGVPTGGDLGCFAPTAEQIIPECSDLAVTASNECGPVDVSCSYVDVYNECSATRTFTFTATACNFTSTTRVTYNWSWESVGDCETAFARMPGDEIVDEPDGGYITEQGPRCFLRDADVLDLPDRWGWTNRITYGEYVMPVYAGAGQCDYLYKGVQAGTATVTYAGNTLTVVFNLWGEYLLSEAHIYAGTEMYPTIKNGKNKGEPTLALGQYPVVWEKGDPAGDFTVTFTDVSPEYIWVIVHAVVCIPTCTCEPTAMGYSLDLGSYSLLQTKGNTKEAVIPQFDGTTGDLKVFPNPFYHKVTFEFVSSEDAQAKLEIYNAVGQRVTTLMDEYVEGGKLNVIDYVPTYEISGVYFYRLDLNGKIRNGRIIYNKQ